MNEPKISDATERQVAILRGRQKAADEKRARLNPEPDRQPTASELQAAYARGDGGDDRRRLAAREDRL